MSHLGRSTDVHEERALIGRTAGWLWLVAAVTAGIGLLLPGSNSVPMWPFVAGEAVVIGYSLACITGLIPWRRVSMVGHAFATGAVMPVIGAAVWATGGSGSSMRSLLLFPLVHVACFFPTRMAVPLLTELALVHLAPVTYESSHAVAAFPARTFSFIVASVVLTVVIRALKGRLVEAEQLQREMACTDVLTGLANRRGFDHALRQELADTERPGCALLLLDLDGFKVVNDTHGHSAGDDLLRRVAECCAGIARSGDTVARIGGDEFAVVAPGAGEGGAERLAAALDEALIDTGAPATIAWAVHPLDGDCDELLLRAADRRLYERKARRRAPHLALTS